MKIKKNGKVINLTESDLKRIVKKVLNEQKPIDPAGGIGAAIEAAGLRNIKDCPPQFAGETTLDRIKCCANKEGISVEDLESIETVDDVVEFITNSMVKYPEVSKCVAGDLRRA